MIGTLWQSNRDPSRVVEVVTEAPRLHGRKGLAYQVRDVQTGRHSTVRAESLGTDRQSGFRSMNFTEPRKP